LNEGAVPEPDSPFLGLTRLVLSRSYRVATIDYAKDPTPGHEATSQRQIGIWRGGRDPNRQLRL